MAGSEHIIEQGREIFKRIVAVENNVGIYPPKHPAALEPAAEVCDLLSSLFLQLDSVSFEIVNSEIYFERKLLSEESIRHLEFIRLLTKHGVNNLSFCPDVTPESITIFFSYVNTRGESEASGDKLRRLLERAGVVGIHFEELVALDIAEEAYKLQDGSTAQSSYNSALDCVQAVEKDILSERGIDIKSLNTAVCSLMSDFLTDADAMMGLLSIKNYNEHLFHHSVNVALTCLLISKKLKLSEEMMKIVGISGLLHDIGKLKIPPEILDKPGKLTDQEREIIKTHPLEGARMLMRYERLGELPVVAAMEHHANNDLSGYPRLQGKKAPHAIARIITVADVYEAMTANRTYRPACTVHETVGILLAGAGKQFNSSLVKLLLDTVGIFPPGSLVRIRTGQMALVVEANEGRPFHPKVRPVDPATGAPYEKVLINTADDPARYAVIGVADPK